MTYWRYAVTKGTWQDFEGGPVRDVYAIREAYFNADDTVMAWDVDTIVAGETLDDLYVQLNDIIKALDGPVIDLTKEEEK